MTTHLTQTLSRLFLQLFFLGLLLSFALGLNYLHAWTAPTQAPTGGNVAAPLNTGGTLQGKSGGLTLGSTLDIGSSLSVGGVLADSASYLIDMGAATPSATAGIRFPDDTVQTSAASGGGANTLSFDSYAHFQNRVSSGVSNIAGGWSTIVLNTNVDNTITGASRSGNQITLPAGTYYVDGSAAAFSIGSGKNVFYNVTDATYPVVGLYMKPNGGSDDQGGAEAPFAGKFTISSSKVFELRMYATEAGYCPYVSVPYDVCADLKIWKLD